MTSREELDESKIDLVLLPPKFDLGGFACEKGDMNDYLRDDAWGDSQAKVSQTHVFYYGGRFVAYLTLSTDAIRLQGKERPDDVRYSTVPALKIARLATCLSHERRGIGEYLIKYAIGVGRDFNKEAGCRYVTLDSHHDKVEYYRRRGFRCNKGESVFQRLVRNVNTGIRLDKDLPNVSMRFDLILEGETPSVAL